MQAMAWEFSGDRAYLDGVEPTWRVLKPAWRRTTSSITTISASFIACRQSRTGKTDGARSANPAYSGGGRSARNRFHHSAGFIQAWGTLNDPQEYRLLSIH